MASKQGDMILDPFCGGGTTCIAAQRLGRQWIGIDASAAAIDVSQMRMRKNFGSHGSTFEVKFERYDYNKLRTMNANDFADFICAHIGGRSNTKKSADGGIDGWLPDDTPIQIKRSDAIGKNVIKNLWSSVQEYDKSLYEKNKAAGKPVGVVYAFSFSKAAWEARSLMKNQHGVIIDLVEIEKLVPMTTALKIELKAQDLNPTPAGGYALPMPTHTIEFSANIKDNTNQQAANCAWDFNYDKNKGFNADELLYNKGKITRTMEAGIYNIAVKVVDDQGVETIEAIRLIVNGGVCANPLISGE
jgi:hypothetical protein